jgi:hypothetical protein
MHVSISITIVVITDSAMIDLLLPQHVYHVGL